MLASRVTHACVRVVLAALLALAIFAPAVAHAKYQPPPLRGHVVDQNIQMSPVDKDRIDAKLERFRQETGFSIVVLVLRTLNGEPIEDVAYTALNTWQIGQKGKDNGVLLVIATAERRVRIETGKGVGGALTDLQSNDIIRDTIGPLLAQGQVGPAVDAGTDKIQQALINGTTPAERTRPRVSPVTIGIGVGVVLLIVVLLIVSPGFRTVFLYLLQMFLFFGGRGGGGGGGGGSGYSGGEGGTSGGGGSSDSY